jgi:hypothetical protein
MISEITVNSITFDNALAHLPPERLDLLQIDAEGADGDILSFFPFNRVKPAIIHWEIKNLIKDRRRIASKGFQGSVTALHNRAAKT